MQNILVTGGCGYIGSHITLELINRGYNVIVFDSNLNSSPRTIDCIRKISIGCGSNNGGTLKFVQGDIRDKKILDNLFSSNLENGSKINSVIHLAGLKSVRESFLNEKIYWDINVNGTINLLKMMIKYYCKNIVFSSSATVYGHPKSIPIFEDFDTNPINPYGKTKLAVENLIRDIVLKNLNTFNAINLRYFNPIGAHNSGYLGEDYRFSSNNIFPNLVKVALKKEKYFKVFGDNWPTPDGTTIRDYIHITDLAEGHIAAIEYLSNNSPGFVSLNLGTGLKTSVLELITTFEVVNKVKIPYKICKKRTGDKAFLLASTSVDI